MVEWSKDYFINPATTGLNAVYQQSSSPEENEQVSTASSGDIQAGRAPGGAKSHAMELAPSAFPAELRPGRAASMSGRYQISESSEQ